MQDPDIELADAARLPEFLAYFEVTGSNSDERRFVGELLVASLENAAVSGEVGAAAQAVAELLRANFELFEDLVLYWAQLEAEDPDEAFSITSLMRSIVEEMAPHAV